jgi:tetratricopeptide (TPR) repeat protein
MPHQQTWQSYLRIATLILCSFSVHPVLAAEFSKTGSPGNGPDIIFVAGDLALGDEKKFINVALSSGDAVVVLQSPGGNLIAGIEIGRAIHLKGFATYVPDNIQCASACALAWLGGRVRYMSNSARVGFHAVYVDNGGKAAVSSSGNALVGAYLNQIGLPPPAIVYITEASPQGMQWLTFTDAQRYGIDVRPFDLSSAPTIAQTGASDTSSSPQVTSIDKELYELIGASNRSNDFALAYLESKYADQVNYYGKVLPRVSVLNDKRSFFTRWPRRSYSIQPATVAVTCESISVCKAQGVLEWNHTSRSMTSLGSATFSFQWVLEENHWHISLEDGKAIRREVTPVPVTSETTPQSSEAAGCQSPDAEKRLVACTAIIDAKGFGSQTGLAAALDGRCWAYNAKRQFDRAISDCKTAIALRPTYYYAYNNLGAAYLGLSDYGDALTVLNKAIDLKPDFFWSRVNRAKAYAGLGNGAEAIKDYEYALVLDPTNEEVRQTLAGLKAGHGR